MIYLRIFLVIMILFLLSCNKPGVEPNGNDGNSKTVRLEKLWQVPIRASTSPYPPAYHDGIVYCTVGWDGVNAYRAKTGELIWQTGGESWPGSASHSRIFISEDKLYVTIRSYLHCYNKDTGDFIFEIRNICDRCGVADENHVYADVYPPAPWGALAGIDKHSGTEKWRYELPGRIWESPGIDGDYLYLALGGMNYSPWPRTGHLVKLNRFTGEKIFSVFVKMPEDSVSMEGPAETPVFYENLVIVESGDGRIYAFDKETGAFVWSYNHGGPIRYALVIKNGVIYVATQDTYMIAINAADGSEIWKSSIMQGSCIGGPAALYEDFLFVNSLDAYTYCFSKQTGEVLLKIQNFWDPIAHEDTLFCGGYIDPYDVNTNIFSAFQIIVE